MVKLEELDRVDYMNLKRGNLYVTDGGGHLYDSKILQIRSLITTDILLFVEEILPVQGTSRKCKVITSDGIMGIVLVNRLRNM